MTGRGRAAGRAAKTTDGRRMEQVSVSVCRNHTGWRFGQSGAATLRWNMDLRFGQVEKRGAKRGAGLGCTSRRQAKKACVGKDLEPEACT